MMMVMACHIDLYWKPMPVMLLIWNLRRRTSLSFISILVRARICFGGSHKGYVQVWATAPDIAPALSLRTFVGFLSPSGVSHFLTDSYVMKFRPTLTRVSGRIASRIRKRCLHMVRRQPRSGQYLCKARRTHLQSCTL